MFATPFQNLIATKPPLEQVFIVEFLSNKGFSLEGLKTLPEDVSNKLVMEACIYASHKMVEIQTRIQYLQALKPEEW